MIYLQHIFITCIGYIFAFNPFVPNAPFLCPQKTDNLTVFWCFHGVEKGCIGNKSIKLIFFSEVSLFHSFINEIHGQTHSNNSSTVSRRIVWECLTILWVWRLNHQRSCKIFWGNLQKQTFANVLHNICVLKNFTIFKGKHLCLSLFLIKLQAWRPYYRGWTLWNLT